MHPWCQVTNIKRSNLLSDPSKLACHNKHKLIIDPYAQLVALSRLDKLVSKLHGDIPVLLCKHRIPKRGAMLRKEHISIWQTLFTLESVASVTIRDEPVKRKWRAWRCSGYQTQFLIGVEDSENSVYPCLLPIVGRQRLTLVERERN